ncbi:hypothetical protein GCM10025780_29320 [Frondihabitans cladoniiphilus]|uniref:Uncharacterized protein n=1 Tax=Frondihabitans cladoniiphilus TaxID=715785 RepID=A0ABP8W6M0_9MICO
MLFDGYEVLVSARIGVGTRAASGVSYLVMPQLDQMIHQQADPNGAVDPDIIYRFISTWATQLNDRDAGRETRQGRNASVCRQHHQSLDPLAKQLCDDVSLPPPCRQRTKDQAVATTRRIRQQRFDKVHLKRLTHGENDAELKASSSPQHASGRIRVITQLLRRFPHSPPRGIARAGKIPEDQRHQLPGDPNPIREIFHRRPARPHLVRSYEFRHAPSSHEASP